MGFRKFLMLIYQIYLVSEPKFFNKCCSNLESNLSSKDVSNIEVVIKVPVVCTQCESFMVFVSSRYYVKSLLRILDV